MADAHPWGTECGGKIFCEGCTHGCKHRGRLVGGWFAIIDGKVEHMPEDRTIFGRRFTLGNPENLPTWERKLEGHAIYNTQDKWCCETCMVEHSSDPETYDAPIETYVFPTCEALMGRVNGEVGSEVIATDPRPAGLCVNWEPFESRLRGPKLYQSEKTDDV